MANSARQPNVLLVTSDEQRWDQLGCTGMTGIGTPHLDRLAREGVCLTRAYTASPTCTPCRVSLLTGTYPSIHGAYCIGVNADPFPEPLLPRTLAAHGYHTALVGKHHFVTRTCEDRQLGAPPGEELEYYRSWHGPWLGFTEVYASTGHTTHGGPRQHYRAWLDERSTDYAQHFPLLGGEAPDYGAWQLPAELSDSAFVADCTSRIITSQADRPWFCWASFQDPHGPYACPREWYERVDTRAMPPPLQGYREGEFSDRPDIYRTLYEANEQWGRKSYRIEGGEMGGVYGYSDYEPHERTIMQAEVGMVGMLDHYIGTILETLEHTGQADNTLIILTSDHGTMLGHHGLWGKGITAYDDCQRVPFIAWGRDMVKARGVCDRLANVVDIPRTILAACGCSAPQGMQGIDLGPFLRGDVERAMSSTLVEYRASTDGPRQNTLVTETRKLVVYDRDYDGELYDLETDPDQHHNLWNEPGSRTLRSSMLYELCRRHLHNQGVVQPRVSFA
jgi:uncharacterized sulfatase